MKLLEPDQYVGQNARVIPTDAVQAAPEHRDEFIGLVAAKVQQQDDEDGDYPPQWLVVSLDRDDKYPVYFAMEEEIYAPS